MVANNGSGIKAFVQSCPNCQIVQRQQLDPRGGGLCNGMAYHKALPTATENAIAGFIFHEIYVHHGAPQDIFTVWAGAVESFLSKIKTIHNPFGMRVSEASILWISNKQSHSILRWKRTLAALRFYMFL
jgi:hypothetical protein